MTDKEMLDLRMEGHRYNDIAVTAGIPKIQVFYGVSREIDRLVALAHSGSSEKSF